MATIIKADGTTVENVKGHGPDGHFTLEQLQRAVGGFIEAVPGSRGRAYCDEQGQMKQLPPNFGASIMFGVNLLGDVIVLEKGDKIS